MLKKNFQFLQKFIYDKSGIVLQENKMYLVDSRFRKIRIKYAIDQNDHIIQQIKNNNQDIAKEVVDVMTTNETSFFRDQRYFDTIKNEIIPKIIKTRDKNKTLKIWSVACSYGQEAYSVAFIIDELKQRQLAGWNIQIVATDLCTRAIERARNAQYSQFEVQRGLPIGMLIKYFTKKGEMWQVKPEITNMIKFKIHNLMDSFSQFGFYDIIMCRNVLMYFDKKTKTDITTRLSQNLTLDGVLILGTVDTIAGNVKTLQEFAGKPGIYQKAYNNAEQIIAQRQESKKGYTNKSDIKSVMDCRKVKYVRLSQF